MIMTINSADQLIFSLEQKLKTAMLQSDVATLNQLMSDELIFTNHLGFRLTKQDDINAHASGKLKIIDITLSDQQVRYYQQIMIVSVLAKIVGQYDDQDASGNFRFTRVWHKNESGNWQVVAVHSSVAV